MNQDVKEQWLAALRSGEYTQTMARLRKGDAFCCLGVLCDLAAKQGIGRWTEQGMFDVDGDRNPLTPPASVADWAGLEYRNPKVGLAYENSFQYTIADYNDGVDADDSITHTPVRPHSFAEIADLIEQHL